MADSKRCDYCGETVLTSKAYDSWITTANLAGRFNDTMARKKNVGEFCSPACVSNYFAHLAGLPARDGTQTQRLSPSLLDKLMGRVQQT